MSLPEATRRLFQHYDEADLLPGQAPSLLIARLLEDGDAADLAWLMKTFPEAALADWLSHHGGHLLSARSRAFWADVLGVPSAPVRAEAAALWPL